MNMKKIGASCLLVLLVCTALSVRAAGEPSIAVTVSGGVQTITMGGSTGTTSFPGQISAVAAHLVLPVASTPSVEDSVEGSVVDVGGILYMYDATRASWLSINRPWVWAARAGIVTNGFLKLFDGISNGVIGYPLLNDATITGLTATSGGNVWYVASSGGDFTTLQAALVSPSVVNGDVIKMSAETFTTATTIAVNKCVTIEGCGTGPIIRTAGDASTPTNVLSITANNVSLINLNIEQRNTGGDCSAITASVVTGLVIRDVSITTMEFGIVVNATQFAIENCDFHYLGALANNHRFIALYGNSGNSRIVDNTFTPSSDTPTPRTVFCYLTSGGTPVPYADSLLVSGNTQVGGNLKQFFMQDSFAGTAGGFGLYFANNTYNDLSGGIIFYGGADLLNLFSSIVLTNNTVSNASGKGLVGIDGVGAGLQPGSTTWYINGNTITNPTISQSGWASACDIPGAVGYNTAVFASFTITYSSVIPAPPFMPSAFSVEIRKNGCPGALALVPIYGMTGGATDLNVKVSAGDLLQTYVAGTTINPTVGVEYAYRV